MTELSWTSLAWRVASSHHADIRVSVLHAESGFITLACAFTWVSRGEINRSVMFTRRQVFFFFISSLCTTVWSG